MNDEEARKKRLDEHQERIDFLDKKYWDARSFGTDQGLHSMVLGALALLSIACTICYSPSWGWGQYFHSPQMSLLAMGLLMSLLCLVQLIRCIGHHADSNKYFNEFKFYEARDFAMHLHEMHSDDLKAVMERMAK